MQLINIERGVIASCPLFHPLIIRKLIGIQITDDRSKTRPQFHTESIRITVLHPPVLTIDHIFIHLTGSGVFFKNLIELGADRHFHLLLRPVVEFPYNTDFICFGCIGTEHDAPILYMGTHVFICVKQIPVIKFLKVHLLPPRCRCGTCTCFV